jgi:Ran GTPase-activating protein (RanGAP) involved in mRNA processing and transport
VFQFYAAITKLKSPGIHHVIDRIVAEESNPLLVSLLRCLHEAQDSNLCLYVAKRLESRLDLSETSLSPLDCLSVSFFISSIAGKRITVNLSQCHIGDLGAKCLTKYLSVSGHTDLVTINLKGNAIHDEGSSHVAKILYFIERLHLDISENPIGANGTSCMFQAVRETTILRTLILIGCTMIPDLLPVENVHETSTGLRTTNCRVVLWIFDDLQPHQYSIFLSPKHNSNTECSIIVTSCHIIDKIVKDKSKPLLVSLLRCLHEAQDPSLCLYLAERLEYELDLSKSSLSPLDCLSVGFFLSSLTGKETSVHLFNCTVGDVGAKCLSKYLHAATNLDCVTKIAIDLARNEIHGEGVLHIVRILHFIEHLYLSGNPIKDTGVSLMSEAVRETPTLKSLILYNCGITSRGAEELSRALTQNSSLEKLDIGCNSLGDEGIRHMAEALKRNKQLKELWIGGGAGITDKGAASLASGLTVNNSLKMLHMGGVKGALTKDGLSTIAHSFANNSLFVKLVIPAIFGSIFADRFNQEVNKARKRNGLPPIQIEGEYWVILASVIFVKWLSIGIGKI